MYEMELGKRDGSWVLGEKWSESYQVVWLEKVALFYLDFYDSTTCT